MLRHLLDHTSGLNDYLANTDFVDAVVSNPIQPWTAAELIQYSIDLGPAAPPGQQWSYTFIDFVLLGAVIEIATAQAVDVVIGERVIAPLALERTFLAQSMSDFDALVPGYNDSGVNVAKAYHPSAWWVAASYLTTADDALKLARGVVGGGLLSDASLNQMLTLTMPTIFPGMYNGLGVREFFAGAMTIYGNEGSFLGFETRAYYAPTIDAAVVVTTNNDDWATLTPLQQAFEVLAAAD
jgi:D-alanyl-D-alanine carboxypeptidase